MLALEGGYEVVGYRRERDRIKDRNILCEHVYEEGQYCSCSCFASTRACYVPDSTIQRVGLLNYNTNALYARSNVPYSPFFVLLFFFFTLNLIKSMTNKYQSLLDPTWLLDLDVEMLLRNNAIFSRYKYVYKRSG